ncbi:hypothetical protein K438DRAFT_1765823 [Mycena galopus ATCC 62051]|nr:hypothetical protein K438DRAFT_1765823 [Mycena galopus ATCC 62051]
MTGMAEEGHCIQAGLKREQRQGEKHRWDEETAKFIFQARRSHKHFPVLVIEPCPPYTGLAVKDENRKCEQEKLHETKNSLENANAVTEGESERAKQMERARSRPPSLPLPSEKKVKLHPRPRLPDPPPKSRLPPSNQKHPQENSRPKEKSKTPTGGAETFPHPLRAWHKLCLPVGTGVRLWTQGWGRDEAEAEARDLKVDLLGNIQLSMTIAGAYPRKDGERKKGFEGINWTHVAMRLERSVDDGEEAETRVETVGPRGMMPDDSVVIGADMREPELEGDGG